MFAIVKALVSGLLVSLISETAKRSPSFGALIASLPLVSVLAMIWLWHETHDSQRIASHAEATFWYVLPSMPMFLILPALLRSGIHFYLAMTISCAITILLYFLMVWFLKKFGISF